VQDIKKIIPGLRKPFICLSAYDYLYLNRSDRKVISSHPHFIWVNPWFRDLESVYARYNLPDPRLPRFVVRKILNSGANFVWAPVPPSCLKFYEEWQKNGQRVESILQACDTTRYYPEYEDKRYSDTIMAFVGGFWAYKNIQFEKYLKPYENILTVFGYNSWPYKRYKGLMPEEDERILYQNARVSPCISEPHAEVTGDIVERVYKVMGSGGLAVTDATPHYHEVFAKNELLIPNNISEYHEMVQYALNDTDLNRQYRDRGFKAILNGHTYRHRALEILRLLGIRQHQFLY
jgi:hypothetical protein